MTGRHHEGDGASSRRVVKMTGRHHEGDGAPSIRLEIMTAVIVKVTVRPQDALRR